jgi:hypothetical protein
VGLRKEVLGDPEPNSANGRKRKVWEIQMPLVSYVSCHQFLLCWSKRVPGKLCTTSILNSFSHKDSLQKPQTNRVSSIANIGARHHHNDIVKDLPILPIQKHPQYSLAYMAVAAVTL